ncbi:MAG: hypothetical protein QM751_05665 [Paludibacteraceae bacterium]
MPTLHSHTHLQATQTLTQTKACKRVCLSQRIDEEKKQRNANKGYMQ